MQFFLQNLMNGISLGILYAIAAIGFVMIYRTSHILNFAHGGLMAMGAFIFLALSSWGRLPMIFALLLTLTGVFAIGLMIEKGFRRTFMASKPIHGAILTIGLALIFKSLFTFLSEMKPSGYSEYVCETLSIRWGTFTIPAPSVAIFILGLVLFVLFGLFLKYSSLGIYVRSIAENRSAALALGIPIKRVLALSWAIAALFCTITGVILAMVTHASIQDLGAIGLKVFPVVALGGLNSFGGAILGGILIGISEALTKGYVSASFGEMVPYLVLLIMILWKPCGLFGTEEVKRSWQ